MKVGESMDQVMMPGDAGNEEHFLVGKVAAIFFENPSNFYKVMLLKVVETNTNYQEDEVVVTGSFGQMQEEETYRFYGHLVDHPKYGKQLQATTYEQEKPSSTAGLIAYLSGDNFPGIGKKTAANIVTELGEKAIDIIMADPERLNTVKGLTPARQAQILETLRLNYGMEQIVIGLNQYGFGSQLSLAIYQLYKEDTLALIQENPYRLTEDIDGIGFKRADNLAAQLGYEADSPQRLRAAIQHELLATSLEKGDTYVEAQTLLQQAVTTLESSRAFEIPPTLVADEIIRLVEEGKIQQEATRLYENSLYFSEWGIGTAIQRLLSRKKTIKYAEEDLDEGLDLLAKTTGMSYGTSQIEAMKAAIRAPLFILTGGPGTGKTTVINGIVTLFAELNGLSLDPDDYVNEIFPILLAAPTGRAAKRMNETTGLPASTIHRLLGLTGREKNTSVSAKELEGGLLIVDEMSMVDTWLANTLLKSIPTNMQVIFVGDKDQLPSVGPGQILHDLLSIEEIPSRELVDIYRQDDDSSIIPLAHEVKQGRLPQDFTQNKKDRSFFPGNAYQIEELIRQVVSRAKAKGFTPQDIQVLVPMYRGVAGINKINEMMQDVFNPNPDKTRKEVVWHDKVYRIGDKVLQLVNSPEVNVFNGDMGEIVGIAYAKETEDKVDELIIQFDASEVTYKRNEWNKITLAYCCSIHKSQGSEFKMVILPMVRQYQRMLQRNLLYTGLTRSKEMLILLGEPQAFNDCVVNEGINRLTSLQDRIAQAGTMSITIKDQLTAFEEGLTEVSSPVSEAPVVATQPSAPPVASPVTQVPLETRRAPEVEKISLFANYEEEQVSQKAPEPSALDGVAPATPLPEYLTAGIIQAGLIDPMLGMGTTSPYDFMPT